MDKRQVTKVKHSHRRGSQLDLLGVPAPVMPRTRLAHMLPQLLRELVVPSRAGGHDGVSVHVVGDERVGAMVQ